MTKVVYLKDYGMVEEQVTELIMKEDSHQIGKWGYQEHHILEWLTYTTEELGELAKAMSEYMYRDGEKEDIIKEATQVATLAVKIAVMAKEQL